MQPRAGKAIDVVAVNGALISIYVTVIAIGAGIACGFGMLLGWIAGAMLGRRPVWWISLAGWVVAMPALAYALGGLADLWGIVPWTIFSISIVTAAFGGFGKRRDATR